MPVQKFTVTADLYLGLDGQIDNIKNKVRLGLKGHCPYNPEQIKRALQDIIEGRFVHGVLRLLTISEDKPVIKATDGQRFLAKAKSTFPSGIDSDFKNWKLNQTSHSTADTSVDVYEMIADATFAQMFGSLSNDLDKLCLTQDQIEEFCLAHLDQLRSDGYATLFLFKENEHFFVARVNVCSDGLRVGVSRREYGNVWFSDNRLRVVGPQL